MNWIIVLDTSGNTTQIKSDWCTICSDGSLEFWRDEAGSHYGLLIMALAPGQWLKVELQL